MSISKEDVFNRSLALIGGPGQTSYIDNAETDDSPQAVWLRIVYPSALDYCAVDLKPGIFKEYRDLDQTASSPESLDWKYVFDKPSEFIHLVRLTNGDDRTKEYDFDDIGKFYFCDFLTPIAEIIISPEGGDLTRWPIGFANMVSARMAREVGSIWKPEIIPLASRAYDEARREAFESQPQFVDKTPVWNENT